MQFRLKVMILRMTAKLVKHRLPQKKMLNGNKNKNREKNIYSQKKRLLFNFWQVVDFYRGIKSDTKNSQQFAVAS